MKLAAVTVLALVAACDASSSSDVQPDAAVAMPDAPVVAEPKPAFTASSEIGGKLAIDDTGIREMWTYNGHTFPSYVIVSLTETGTTNYCGVTISPTFVQFGSASTSTRHFKTVVLGFANAKVLDDKCGWDDAWILGQLDQQFGNYIVGFAQARFAEDQPNVDVYYDAVQPFPNSTANIVVAGGGLAYGMSADGTVGETIVQPMPGTLLPAMYDF